MGKAVSFLAPPRIAGGAPYKKAPEFSQERSTGFGHVGLVQN